jgi:hypothetical protein
MLKTKKFYVFLTLGMLFGLANIFSTAEQFGILRNSYNPSEIVKFCVGFIYGITAAAILSKLNWKLVPSGGVFLAVFAAFVFQFPSDLLIKAFALGLFLMVFDWVFENLGAKFGFWYSKNSSFFIKAVPIEVMIGALSGGIGWALLMPRTFDPVFVLLISLFVGIAGALGENTLKRIGNMEYGNSWTWKLAVVSYFLVWLMLSFVWYFLINV